MSTEIRNFQLRVYFKQLADIGILEIIAIFS